MFPVIVCIIKNEHDYIEEFVKYHLALGFSKIYIYDNQDISSSYDKILHKYSDKITINHVPGNNYKKAVQYYILDHFVDNYLFKINKNNENITHVAHIDIDEFIALKKHKNICDFINEYIINNCQGIAINWRFFGSSGKKEKTNELVTQRFTMCEQKGNIHIKTLFKKDYFVKYNTVHDITLSQGNILSTNGQIINSPFNENIDFNIIQLNHYKCKTLSEFYETRKRGRADLKEQIIENIEESFKLYDMNEIEDLTAKNFMLNYL